MSKLADLEHKTYHIITESGSEGILQSALWKEMGSTGRKVSRLVLRLEKKGLIERKRELYNGRWTYRIISYSKLTTIDSIMDVPCAICNFISRCSEESIETIINCKKMSSWRKHL